MLAAPTTRTARARGLGPGGDKGAMEMRMDSPSIAGGRVTLLADGGDVRPGARKAVDDIEQPDESWPSLPRGFGEGPRRAALQRWSQAMLQRAGLDLSSAAMQGSTSTFHEAFPRPGCLC